MLFDSPEIREMIAHDNQFLTKGKIDWEAKLLPIANEIANCKNQLSIEEISISKLYMEEHPDFSIEKHKAKYLSRLDKARKELSKLIAQISDKERNKRIEALANDIKNWESQDSEYSWKDIALAILRFPDRIVFDYDTCPNCGQSRIRVFFYSPDWTWAMMCGVGGNMIICPDCRTQSEFNETIRN